MADFEIKKVIEMIEEQMAKGMEFESLVYEFRYRHHDCTVAVNHRKENGRVVGTAGVEVPETNRMFYMDCVRDNNLEAVLDFFKNPENEKIVRGTLNILVQRVMEED